MQNIFFTRYHSINISKNITYKYIKKRERTTKTKSKEEISKRFNVFRRDLWRIEDGKFHRVTSADSIRRAIGFFFPFFLFLPFNPLLARFFQFFGVHRRSVASIVLPGTINVPCWRESLTRFTKSALACDCVRTRSIPPLRKEQCVENVINRPAILIPRPCQRWGSFLCVARRWLKGFGFESRLGSDDVFQTFSRIEFRCARNFSVDERLEGADSRFVVYQFVGWWKVKCWFITIII